MSLLEASGVRRAASSFRGDQHSAAAAKSGRFTALRVASALAVACIVSFEATATGFFVNQQSIGGLGRVHAGEVAAARDVSTVFYNPAGLTYLELAPLFRERPANSGGDAPRVRLSFGANAISVRGNIRDSGTTVATPGTGGAPLHRPASDGDNPYDVAYIPNLNAAVRPFGDPLVVGLGVSAPFGFAAEYDPEWFGRYDTIDAVLRAVNVSLVVARRFGDHLSLAAGLDVQRAKAILSSAVPNPLVPGGPTPATDARFTVRGDDWTVGFNVGAMYDLGERWRLAVHYRSEMDHDLNGVGALVGTPAVFGADFRTDAGTEVELPAILSTGIVYSRDLWRVFWDFSWFEWSDFEEVRIEFDNGQPDLVRTPNFRNTWATAVGFEYDFAGTGTTVRAGLKFDRTPTRDAFRDTAIPDSNRVWLGAGASYRVATGWFVDFSAVHVFFEDVSVDTTTPFFANTAVASTVRTQANVDLVANTVAIQIRGSF